MVTILKESGATIQISCYNTNTLASTGERADRTVRKRTRTVGHLDTVPSETLEADGLHEEWAEAGQRMPQLAGIQPEVPHASCQDVVEFVLDRSYLRQEGQSRV